MFEKIGRAAERAVEKVSVSRRGFLGRLGQAALAALAVLGGFATHAAAQTSVVCCAYSCPGGGKVYKSPKRIVICNPAGTTCDPFLFWDCKLVKSTTAATCSQC